MAVTTIILNVKSATADDDTVSATDSTRSKFRTIRSSETVTSTNDVNDVNDEGASESSDKTNVTLNDPTKNDSILTALSVSVECDFTPKPDIILFMVVDSYNSQCVCALVPFAESRHVEVDGELSSLTVNAYGSQRRNGHGGVWHAVLSHSHLGTTNTASHQVTEDLSSNGVLTIKMPNLSFGNIGNPFPFSVKKSTAKVYQDEWMEDKYTLSCLHQTSKIIFLRQMKDGRLTILVHQSYGTDVTIPFPLRPASDFDVHIMEIVQESGNVFKSNIPSEKLYFRTKMSQDDVVELYSRASSYVNENYPRYQRLPWLYRNKSVEYFDDINNKKRGWMNAYTKNDGGDPASCLNGRIKGLFFSAVIDEQTGLPPNFSPFGQRRVVIPIRNVFNKRMNLYFADFYCHSPKRRHKVTLVLSAKGSEEDYFCRSRLVLLDPYDNPFLKELYPDVKGAAHHVVANRVIVEVFLTMDLNLWSQYPPVCFEDTEVTSSGKSMEKGLPKCPTCNVCNLSRFCS